MGESAARTSSSHPGAGGGGAEGNVYVATVSGPRIVCVDTRTLSCFRISQAFIRRGRSVTAIRLIRMHRNEHSILRKMTEPLPDLLSPIASPERLQEDFDVFFQSFCDALVPGVDFEVLPPAQYSAVYDQQQQHQ